MLNFVFQKILDKKWMFISLLIGNLLLISVAAASPMYSQAVLQRTLMQSMNTYMVENNQYPGTIRVRSTLFDKSDPSELENLEETVFGIADEMDLPSLVNVTRHTMSNVRILRPNSTGVATGDDSIELTAVSDLADHIRITHGEMFSNQLGEDNTFDVLVNEKIFVEMEMSLNEVIELRNLTDDEGVPFKARVTGIFDNLDEQDPYWLSSPSQWNNMFLMDEDLFLELVTTFETQTLLSSEEWHLVLDYTQMQADHAEEMLQIINDYQTRFRNMRIHSSQFYFQETLESFVTESRQLNTTILVLQVPIFMLLAAFIFMVSRQMLEIEQNEISIFKSRGASKKQIIWLYFLQSVLVAAVGIVGGIPIGVLICKLIGSSNDFLSFVSRTALPVKVGLRVWLFAGAAALFSVCTMVLPVFRYSSVTIVDYKRRKNRSRTRSWWQLICLDIVLLALSLYNWFRFNGQEDLLTQQVSSGASLDPMLYFSSSLFMLGAGLLFLRLLPWIIRLIFRIGRKFWPPSVYASFLRIIRANDNQGFLAVFLVLTIAMGIFNTQMARTINTNSEERLRYVTGADVVFQEKWKDNSQEVLATGGQAALKYEEPNFDKYQSLDGSESITKVMIDRTVTASVPGGSVENVMLMGIDTKEFGETAWFKESLLPVHWYEYLNAMSQNSRAILVSSNFRDRYGYQTGDILYYTSKNGDFARGIIYGFVDYWPSYSPITRTVGDDGVYSEQENFLIVAHLAQLQSSWGITPYQVWVKTEDSSQYLYDFAAETGTRYTIFNDASAQLISLKNDPVFQGTNGILTIGFIIVLLLCATGFLIYWILSIQSRTLQFGIFRAMGMSQKEVLGMLLIEQLFISGSSIGAGVLVGQIGSALFVPLIQITYSAADKVIPLEIVSEAADYLRLGGVIGAMLILCMIILGALISRIRISQALKLGED